MEGRREWLTALAGCCLLAGCVTADLSGADNGWRARGAFVDTTAVSSRGPVALRASGLGIHRSSTGFTIGWFSETTVLVPPGDEQCRVILIGNSVAETAAMVEVLAAAGFPVAGICGSHVMEEEPQ